MRLISKVDPTEFNWRDPEMPVVRNGIDRFSNKKVQLVLSPQEQQDLSTEFMRTSDVPDWRNDPTYNMRRRKK